MITHRLKIILKTCFFLGRSVDEGEELTDLPSFQAELPNPNILLFCSTVFVDCWDREGFFQGQAISIEVVQLIIIGLRVERKQKIPFLVYFFELGCNPSWTGDSLRTKKPRKVISK